MSSILSLEVKKESSLRKAASPTPIATKTKTEYSATIEGVDDCKGDPFCSLRQRIYQIRKQQPADGYQQIISEIQKGETRKRGVKAGKSIFNFVKNHDVIESAQWASAHGSKIVNQDSTHQNFGDPKKSNNNKDALKIYSKRQRNSIMNVHVHLKSNNHKTENTVERLRQFFDSRLSPSRPAAISENSVRKTHIRKITVKQNSSVFERHKEDPRRMTTSVKQSVSLVDQNSSSISCATEQVKTPITCKEKKLPAYVTCVRKVQSGDELNQQMALTDLISTNETRFMTKLNKEHASVMVKLEKSQTVSDKITKSLFKGSEDFYSLKSKLVENLCDSIDTTAFERSEDFSRKFAALEIALSPYSSKGATEGTSQELHRLRETSKKLKNIQFKHNLSKSNWFRKLIEIGKESNTPLSIHERQFLAIFRELITKGYVLDQALFQNVLIHAVSVESQKNPNVQRLISFMRDTILGIDMEEHLMFLQGNNLPVASAFLEKLEDHRSALKKQSGFSDTSLIGGVRAAAIAMKWKRHSFAPKRRLVN